MQINSGNKCIITIESISSVFTEIYKIYAVLDGVDRKGGSCAEFYWILISKILIVR